MGDYGRLTPERLRSMMFDYGYTSQYAVCQATGIQSIRMSHHMRGIRPLGLRNRKRLAKIFTKKSDQVDLFL